MTIKKKKNDKCEILTTAMKEENDKYPAWKTANPALLTFFHIILFESHCRAVSFQQIWDQNCISLVSFEERSVQVRKRVNKHLRTLEFELITLLLHWNVLSHEYVDKSMSFRGLNMNMNKN